MRAASNCVHGVDACLLRCRFGTVGFRDGKVLVLSQLSLGLCFRLFLQENVSTGDRTTKPTGSSLL